MPRRAVLMVGGGILGFALEWLALERSVGAAQQVFLVAAFVAALYATTIAWDGAFVLSGIALGYRVEAWNVGPVFISRAAGAWRPRHDWRWWIPVGGGPSLMASEPDGLRWRMVAVIGCPLVASSLLGASMLSAGILLHDPRFLPLAAGAFVSVAVHMVPWTTRDGGWWSMGLWLWRSVARPEVAARRQAIHELRAQDLRGVRPRLWDGRWVAIATAGPARPDARWGLIGLEFAYAAALDRGDVELAGAMIDRRLANIGLAPGELRQLLLIEPAFFVARYRHDPELAAQLLEGTTDSGKPVRTAALERARAAAALAAGGPAAALAHCEAATAAMDALPRTGWGQLDRELLDAVAEDARRALQVVS
jgi:hypothetical protein